MTDNKTLAFDEALSFRWYDEDGRMHVDRSNLTRVQVAPYRGAEIPGWESLKLDPVKVYYGYRPAEELSNPETVKSVIGIPIQLNHHADTPEAPAMETRVGSTGDRPEFDGEYLSNSLHIQNEDACKRIRDGSMRQLSLAYYYDPDFRSVGEYNGQKYDFTMRNIRGQHLALVEEGRAGKTCLVEDSALKGIEAMNDKTKVEEAEVKLAEAAKHLHDLLHGVQQTEEEDKPAEAKDEGEGKEGTAEDDKLSEAVSGLEAALKELKAALGKPEEPEAEVEAEVKAEDEDKEEKPAESEAPEDLDEVARDALKACGYDNENEDFKKAFAAGVHFGEKAKAKAEESEAEDEGEEEKPAQPEAEDEGKDKDEDDKQTAQDAAMRRYEEKLDAIDTCEPILGKVRRTAYDCAEDVYLDALKQAGFSNMKIANRKNAQALFAGFMAGKAQEKRGVAQDAKTVKDDIPAFARGLKVRI